MDKSFRKAYDLYSKGDYKNALAGFKKMLNKTPELAFVYYNIGLCHYGMLNYISAEKMFQKSYDYGFKKSGYELSLSKFHLGKLEEALKYYSYRYYNNSYNFPDLPLKKATKYEDLVGKRVFVLNEQGFGDEILFSRSLKMLNNISSYTKYQVYDELYSVFNNSFHYDNIEFFSDRSFNIEFIKGYDCWIPSGDLFKIHTLKNGFDYVPILLKGSVEDNSVGICWMANSLSKNFNLRSVDSNKLKEFIGDKKVYSLQKDAQLDWAINSEIKTFSDTLNIISKVGEVNSVDTSVLHLSLVCNKPTRLLHNKYIDWRWKYPLYGVDVEKISF